MGIPVVEPETDTTDRGITDRLSENSNVHQPQTQNQTTTYSASDGSPVDSLRSNHISIVSLNDDDDSSSLADSDSDIEDIHAKVPAFIADAIRNGAPQTIPASSNGMIVINNGISGVSEMVTGGIGNGRPHIGSIALQNSSDITFGDKTFYQGPVTVKQFFIDKDRWRTVDGAGAEGGSGSGCDNAAFVPSEVDDRKESNDQRNNEDQKSGSWHKLMELEKRPLMLTIVVTAALLLIGMLSTMLYLLMRPQLDSIENHTGDGDDDRLNIPVESSIGYGAPLRLIARPQWLAQPPSHTLNPLELPSNRVIIAHTATEQCTTQAECVFQVRTIQTFHMDSMGWDDIGYNFLVGGDGAAYEGRGWNTEGAHTKGFNKRSICIAFIGTFISVLPPERQLQVALKLIEEGLRLGKLDPNYKLYGHRQLMGTESPGLMLYEEIKTNWPHWSDELNPT